MDNVIRLMDNVIRLFGDSADDRLFVEAFVSSCMEAFREQMRSHIDASDENPDVMILCDEAEERVARVGRALTDVLLRELD